MADLILGPVGLNSEIEAKFGKTLIFFYENPKTRNFGPKIGRFVSQKLTKH